MIDLAVLIGASGKNKDAHFAAQIAYIKAILTNLTISTKDTLLGIVPYGQDVMRDRVFKIGQLTLLSEIMDVLDDIANPGDGVDIQKALQFVRTYLFKVQNGARSNVPKVIMLFVDRKSANDELLLSKEVTMLKNLGVKIVVIVVGDEIDPSDVSNIVDPTNIIVINIGQPSKPSVDTGIDVVKVGK